MFVGADIDKVYLEFLNPMKDFHERLIQIAPTSLGALIIERGLSHCEEILAKTTVSNKISTSQVLKKWDQKWKKLAYLIKDVIENDMNFTECNPPNYILKIASKVELSKKSLTCKKVVKLWGKVDLVYIKNEMLNYKNAEGSAFITIQQKSDLKNNKRFFVVVLSSASSKKNNQIAFSRFMVNNADISLYKSLSKLHEDLFTHHQIDHSLPPLKPFIAIDREMRLVF